LQVESFDNKAVAVAPGCSATGVIGLAARFAGLPRIDPDLSNTTPGNPVNEQRAVDLLVNTRLANWCPAAPEARSTVIDSAAVGQPGGPTVGAPVGLLLGWAEPVAEPVAEPRCEVSEPDASGLVDDELDEDPAVAELRSADPRGGWFAGGALVQAVANPIVNHTTAMNRVLDMADMMPFAEVS
jgi:hypothetical protein